MPRRARKRAPFSLLQRPCRTRKHEMVWPITRGKSCVGERGKSMKAEESALAEEDGCRKISITLIDLFGGVSAMA
jgi:hypothetical protein